MQQILIIRSRNIDHVKEHFEALGMSFVSEQHGDGPVHYSYGNDTNLIEIYPAKDIFDEKWYWMDA